MVILGIVVAPMVLAQSAPLVQTNPATFISNTQATLNGYLSDATLSTNYVYFQWGKTTNYGSETPQHFFGYSGTTAHNIVNLTPGTVYHYRAVSQGLYGKIYGQDATFTTTGVNDTSLSFLSIKKQALNVTSGNPSWFSTAIYANPSDILNFAITLQGNGREIHNVTLKDILPQGLIYKGNLAINMNPNYGGDITSGINIGTVYSGSPVMISYQAQVDANSLNFGQNNIVDNTTITSDETGEQSIGLTILTSKSLVYGASTISTGLTNYFFADSFFLPLLLIIAGVWFYFSGSAYEFADWLKAKR